MSCTVAEQPARLPTLTFRLNQDWGDVFHLRPTGEEPIDLVGMEIEARLVEWARPEVLALEATVSNGLLEIGDRTEDGVVPLVTRVPAATVAAELLPKDYRLDLRVIRDGQTSVVATALRQFRR